MNSEEYRRAMVMIPSCVSDTAYAVRLATVSERAAIRIVEEALMSGAFRRDLRVAHVIRHAPARFETILV